MNDLNTSEIPPEVTVSCPEKRFQQRYLNKGCFNCDYFKGVEILTSALEKETKDSVTGAVTGSRELGWHERFMIRCSFPMTRRCSNMAIVEE